MTAEKPRDAAPAGSTPAPNRAAAANPADRNSPRLANPDRLTALGDGVFAIVLTILVLEIAVPEALAGQSLRSAVEELRPTFVAWVVSFLIVGMFWVAHRDLFSRAQRVNRDVVWLNLLYLLPVSLVPFAASMIGAYPEEPIALRVYGAVMIAASLVRLALYWYLVRHPALLWPDQPVERAGLGAAIAASPILVYATAMAVAGASATLSITLYFAVPVLYFLLITVLGPCRVPGSRPTSSPDAARASRRALWGS